MPHRAPSSETHGAYHMDALSVAKTLHPLEVRILLAYDPGSEIDGETLRRNCTLGRGRKTRPFPGFSPRALSRTREGPKAFFSS
jgi:hypothetical protein